MIAHPEVLSDRTLRALIDARREKLAALRTQAAEAEEELAILEREDRRRQVRAP